MGLFDFLKKVQEKVDAFQNQMTIAEPQDHKQSKLAKQIIRRFYSDYPEPPYISNDRSKEWIEKAELFPKQNIIPVSVMTRFSDGLLPGHVYMLYWLQKYTNKKVPAYFEYKYGVDFEKEKAYLRANGFLDDWDKPTEKGEKTIKRHSKVVERHAAATAKPDSSTQILAQQKSIIRNGFAEYEFIANRDCCSLCGELNGKHFRVSDLVIGVNAPPMHEGCRCSIAGWSDRSEYEKWLNSL